jgi:hypothetical protein
MDVANFLSESSFWLPEHLSEPFSWVGHIPFAFWLVGSSRPELVVELGAHSGNSYLAFCQSVAGHGLTSRCFAVDTWRGDQHTGCYDESAFERIREINHKDFREFSRLIRCTFDDALSQFDDDTIDLLHIDGYHTYEAVRHDFENWLPKMSKRGVVLLHDTNVHQDGFGVDRFFRELEQQFPTFEFLHNHGLGIVCVGSLPPPSIIQLTDAAQDETLCRALRDAYSRLGAMVDETRLRHDLIARNESLGLQLAGATGDLIAAGQCMNANSAEIRELRTVLDAVGQHAHNLQRDHDSLKQERNVLWTENDSLRTRNESWQAENNSLLVENNSLRAEKNSLLVEKNSLVMENNSLLVENNALRLENGALQAENESLASTKAILMGEIEAVQASRSWSLIHRLRTMQRAL